MWATVSPGLALSTRRTRGGDTTSPPVITVRSGANASGASSAIRWKSPEDSHRSVTRSRASTSAVSAGLSRASGGKTRQAPRSSTPQISSTDASNEKELLWSMERPGPSAAKSCRSAKAVTLRCSTRTALGRPVEPEVYIAYARSPGSAAPAAGSASASSSGPVSAAGSSRTQSARAGGRAVPGEETTTRTPLSLRMCANRCSG